MRNCCLSLAAAILLAMACTSHAAEKPRPAKADETQPKKVWTNDDLETLRTRSFISIVGQEPPAAAPQVQITVVPAAPAFPVYESRLDDPKWYAEQAGELQDALDRAVAALQQEQDALTQAEGGVTQPGVALDKPSVGVTPDAALALLQAQVDDIQMKLDGLSNLARQHNIEPGVLRS